MTNQYPFGALPKRRLILVGKGKPGSLRGELVKLQGVAERKQHSGDAQGNPSQTIDWDLYGKAMAERRRREMSGDEETK